MDTLGNLIDKQITVTLKIHYSDDDEKSKNLNIQRDCLTNEINRISEDILQSNIDINDALRPQYKTY